MIIELHTIEPPRTPAADVGAVVVYGRAGRVALALHRDPLHETLQALQGRLVGKGFALLARLSPAALAGWAARDTPPRALVLARRILTSREFV